MRTALEQPVIEAPRLRRDLVPNALTLGGVLVAWALVARVEVGGRPLLAGPLATFGALADGALATDLLATFARAGAGLVLGTIIGLALGLLVWALARVAPIIDAVLDFARSVPPVVLLPIFLLALGYGDAARVGTIAAGCAVIMATSVSTALRAPLSARGELLQLSGATRLQVLRWTQPWEALPTLVAGLRICAATAVIVATVAEMVAGAPSGIGARIVSAQVAGQTAQLTASIVAVGLAGTVINVLLRQLQHAVIQSQGGPK